tara:strand:- start:69 stop:290 length:222 start_codon:yes stop_codon:yes gene_type:complete
MVKYWNVIFNKKAPKGFKVGVVSEITDKQKNKFSSEKYNLTVVNSEFWKEEEKPKPKKTTKKKKVGKAKEVKD